jgi:hypothetical protein
VVLTAKTKCRFCQGKVPKARAKIYQHCTTSKCVEAFVRERRSRMAINLIPKSGFQPVFIADSHRFGKTTKG